MAHKKQPTAVSSQQQVVTLVKKPETLVGALALTSLGIIGVNMFRQPSDLALSTELPSAELSITTPEPSVVPTASPITIGEESTASATPSIAAIEKLADTSAGQVVVALNNDTFWSIAKRICGQGAEGYRIEKENGYQFKHLQPGDEVVVTCN